MWEAELPTSDETPFRVALIGDWSGRVNRSLFASSSELAASRPLAIDRDNLDRVMSKLGVKLHIPVASDGSLSLTVEFSELDDFHPDRLFQRLEIFENLRRRRREPIVNETQSTDSRAEGSRGSLLDQILEAKPGEVSTPSSSLSPEISALAREAVKPLVLPDDEAEREQFVAAVDAAITKELRAIMHHPDFRSLESAWRALGFLVSRTETGPDLKLQLLDISRPELEADLLGENEIESTALYKILVEHATGTPGAVPWAVICANFELDSTSKDAKLLERISMIAGAAGAPFIAGGSSKLAGCESLAATPDSDDWRWSADAETDASWESLKQLPGARFLGLALPRFLVRLPYGADTEPTEEIDFEELPEDDIRHENYLWANPAFAVIHLLAKAFSESGWDLRQGDFQEIEGLPLHVSQQDGESRIKPCAEIVMTVRAAEKIIERGLMPLIWMKDTDVIRLGLFQSIAGTRLAGRWGQ